MELLARCCPQVYLLVQLPEVLLLWHLKESAAGLAFLVVLAMEPR